MAQTIVVLCDECLEGGTEIPGQTYAVAIAVPGTKAAPYEIDACLMHGEPYRQLLKTLGEYGRRTDRKTPLPRVSTAGAVAADVPPGSVACPAGCGYVGPSESAAKSHVNRHHKETSWGQLMGTARGVTDDYPCPEPGCERHFTTPQGLGRHRLSIHGVPGETRASAGARE